jgi:hypothetical protein
MKTTKYLYSSVQNWFGAVGLIGMIIFPISMIIEFASDYGIWLFMIPFFIIMTAMAIYFCRKFFFPLLRGEIALELDEEKLQFFITKRTIYWTDIKSIDHDSLNHGGWSINFTITHTGENITISTKYVAGDDEAIYDSIVGYFEKYR